MKRTTNRALKTLWTMAIAGVLSSPIMAENVRVYVGTYTNGTKSEGIYRFDLDTATGKATEPVVAAKVTNPSFLAVHKDGKHVYAVNEIDTQNSKKTGGMTAFEIQPNGDLKLLNAVETGGGAPCHITIDPSGKYAFFANYGGGSSGAAIVICWSENFRTSTPLTVSVPSGLPLRRSLIVQVLSLF